MDQKTLDEGGQKVLNFKCAKILPGVDKSIACQTSKKTNGPLPTKSKEGTIQLPETYKVLADLFDHMTCSLRLLRLCKKSTTFRNICTQVEVLTKRKFSYMHLAQIKYVLPEAIHIEKVLVHDTRNLCMKPDLKITLEYEVVVRHASESTYMAFRQLFGSRLLDFFNAHPEVAESLDCSHEKTDQTQGGSATWQQKPSSLLGLVDVIYSIFGSVKCSPITNEELLHKIIMNSLDFVEIREAEEQINFLEKVMPDWIFRKLDTSGDIMYRMKKGSDLETVGSKLSSTSISTL